MTDHAIEYKQCQDKICLVTGGTNGIGEVTARVLAENGATVVVVGRSQARAEATLARIRQANPQAEVSFLLADLSVQAQVHRLAEEFQQRHPRLDVLVNNAGVFLMEREQSADGIEMTWATNHLGYFLLTSLLLDALRLGVKANGEARIVNVASEAHRGARLNFDDLENKGHYSGYRVYSQSKLANVLFTYELARRLAAQGDTGITVNALHPGFVRSGFGRNNGGLMNLGMRVAQIFAISPEQGAQTSIYLACSPEVKGVTGKYFDKQKDVPSDKATYDEAAARRLWEASEAMLIAS